MSGIVLVWAVALAQVFLLAAMGCNVWRMVRGPRAQDRVLAFDALYVNGMLLLLVFGVDSDDSPDGIPIKNRTRFRELAGRDSDLIPDSFST